MPIVALQGTADTPEGWNCVGPGSTILICQSATQPASLIINGRVRQTWTDPLKALASISGRWMPPIGETPGRWVGFLSYDLGRLFESLPATAADDLNLPLFAFVLIRDEWNKLPVIESDGESSIIDATFTRPHYEQAVQRSIDYIAAGDMFQVNLSQRFAVRTSLPAHAIFNRLNKQSPATYGALLDFDDFAIVSNSPELFLHVTPDRRVITRPIKGTRPNLPGMAEELLHSVKDQAELNMIVDLERNDLGRVCEIGSVRVTQPREIESHPTVLHGVATVEGQLRRDVSFVDLLRATFPGGSITGAPKIRAMQIIEEIEPVRRGPYCGAIGTIAANGEMIFNVAIRTMTLKDGVAYVPVGGGIVADSSPAAEYEETLVKARAMFAALGLA